MPTIYLVILMMNRFFVSPSEVSTVSEAALETAEEERPTKVLFVEAELSSASGSDDVRSSPSSARSSLNAIDFKFIDHLVGPRTTSSRLRTDNRLTISDVDVSLTMMEKRRTLHGGEGSTLNAKRMLKFPDFALTMDCYKRHLGEHFLVIAEVKLPPPRNKNWKMISLSYLTS
jgi:hypothetical protein